MKTFICIAIICLMQYSQVYSQSARLFSKEDIVRDIDFLIEDIESIHPEPFHSIKKEDFQKKVEDIKNQLNDSLCIIEAWKNSYAILALLKEGHSYFFPPMKEIGDFLRFPYTIKIDKKSNNFIISGSLIDITNTPIGARILSINGISTDSIIDIFKKSISAENEAFFIYNSEKHFDLSLYAVFGSPDYFDIELLVEDNIEVHKVKSLNNIPHKNTPEFTFRLLNDSVGILDINSMYSLRDFKKFCKSTFKYLNKKRIPHLIIDFRGNNGGDSRIGDELIKYLSNVPFIQYQRAVTKVSSASKHRYTNLSTNDTIIEIELAGFEKYMTKPYPEKKRFLGNVYVLIDGGTYSSAGSTVWCINHYNLAKIIGNETGGAGVHYGYPMKRNLPNTGLTYYISHMKWYQIGADDNSTHGLIPEYEIDFSIDNVKNKKDADLEFAIELIKQVR
ncbi:MAG: hypothetical protein KGZ86_08255 [Candidatus Latescibacteria bacterium]|nr:hypothetical protein [Candidatus Latescibacterota bacterium]